MPYRGDCDPEVSRKDTLETGARIASKRTPARSEAMQNAFHERIFLDRALAVPSNGFKPRFEGE